MSYIPDRCKRGYKSQRDTRASSEKNIRFKCPYCPRDNLLYTSYGLHIFKEHLDTIFLSDTKDSTENRKALQYKKAIKEPVTLITPRGDSYWCFGCQTCFKKKTMAENHFEKHKGCQEFHKENLFQLKDKYPIEVETVKTKAMPHKAKLEFFIESLIERVRELETKHKEEKMDYEKEFGRYFEDWGMNFSEEELSKEWEFLKPKEESKEPTPPPTPPSEPEEDDILPLVVEKPLTKEEVMKKLLSEQEIAEIAKIEKKEPPVEQMKRGPKPFYGSQPTAPIPAPPPPPPSDEKDEKIKQMEAQLLEYESFTKMTPWQKLVKANPACSIQDLIRLAASSGIKPDAGASFKIVGNTKRPN